MNFLSYAAMTLAILLGQAVQAQNDISYQGILGDPRNLAAVRRSWNPLRYSEGYVLGVLSAPGNRGYIVHTLEGELRLGQFSSDSGVVDRTCEKRQMEHAPRDTTSEEYENYRLDAVATCTVNLNPWYFSNYHGNLVRTLKKLPRDYVVVYYDSYYWVPFVDSNNYLGKVYPTDPSLLSVGDRYPAEAAPVSVLRRYDAGFVDGRIVKASLDGTIRNGYSVAIQVSNSGAQYELMNVADTALFDFIVKAMASGRYLRVFYQDLYRYGAFLSNLLHGYKSYYRVYQVQVLEEPSDLPAAPTPE